jgi:VanZ family protein
MQERSSYPLRWRPFWLGCGWLLVAATVVTSLVPAPPGAARFPDKLAHALVYGTLALWFFGIYRRAQHWRIALWLAALGVALEFAQGLGSTRFAEEADALANVGGIALAVVAARAGLAGWCGRVESLFPGGRAGTE